MKQNGTHLNINGKFQWESALFESFSLLMVLKGFVNTVGGFTEDGLATLFNTEIELSKL